MTALTLALIALALAISVATYAVISRRQDRMQRCHEEWQAKFQAPVLKPDPRVDELVRVVSTLRGGEALKSLGVK